MFDADPKNGEGGDHSGRKMKGAIRTLAVVCAGVGGLYSLGPYEPVELAVRFDETSIGRDIDRYLAQREGVFDDLTPGAQKHVVWADEVGKKTPISVIYAHGFSASAHEIRPVPDRVAEGLGANLYFMRLAGHGRDGAAMAGPTVNDWMVDMAEAMAIGRRLGEKVVVLSTSTGSTIASLMAGDAQMSEDLAGIVNVSPNFAINDPAAFLLTWPGARYWAPLVAGETRRFEPRNQAHADYWSESYPTTALMPMAAMVKAARGADVENISVPALFYYDRDDQVVRGDATAEIAARWGGEAQIMEQTGSEGDPAKHLIAGDIMAPMGTDPLVEAILAWVADL